MDTWLGHLAKADRSAAPPDLHKLIEMTELAFAQDLRPQQTGDQSFDDACAKGALRQNGETRLIQYDDWAWISNILFYFCSQKIEAESIVQMYVLIVLIITLILSNSLFDDS